VLSSGQEQRAPSQRALLLSRLSRDAGRLLSRRTVQHRR
jgi:hypothetical protein